MTSLKLKPLVAVLGIALGGAPPIIYADADQVFLNARAYTLNAYQPWAEAIAVEGERVYSRD